jgi:hypothetical protein
MTPVGEWDFFVSYTKTDREWAEWIAWILEENDYRVLIQAWDIVPGTNWISAMHVGTQKADRTIAVLSDAYLKSVYGGAEWEAAWRSDPTGSQRKLLVVRIAPTDRPGLLGGVVGVDLYEATEADARVIVLEMAESAIKGRKKPLVAPKFPGAVADRAVPAEPQFPGAQVARSTGDWADAIAAVVDGDGNTQGTAFFVGSDVALTSLDILDAAGGRTGKLKPAGQGAQEAIVAVDRDEALGLALVRVEQRPGRHWVALSDQQAMEDHDIWSRGFLQGYPHSKYRDGFPMTPARVLGGSRRVGRDQPVHMLMLGAEPRLGMSGAPAVDADTNAVIGILRARESETFAVLADEVKRGWPALPASTDGQAPVFADLAAPDSVTRDGWEEFDPASLHCLVVGSESLAGRGPKASLTTLVNAMLSSPMAPTLWDAFRQAWDGRELLRSGPRAIPANFSSANVRVASFGATDAFTSRAGLERVVRLVVQADLALFDVTGFEPGVMLLLGIRAATRRGVTINSHGGVWLEGAPLNRPFNLSDLSLSSHTPMAGPAVGPDLRIGRLVDRICTGFGQLACQPHYLDLPVYEALRQLGSQENAWASIPLEKQVLMLCSYGEDYFDTWQSLRDRLSSALYAEGMNTNVSRLQDLATPQLVSQSLYERIRRCTGCVADWTFASPSTFFELGVRLAVSQWSVVQILKERWLREEAGESHYAKQIAHMRALLDPLLYRDEDDDDIGHRMARQLISIRGRSKGSRGHLLRQVAAAALGPTLERLPHLPGQLLDEADALDHKNRPRDNIPQALFYEITEIKQDQEQAALERRLAAWLYLEHRVGAAQLDDADQRKHTWRELGKIIAGDLYNSMDDADQALAEQITQRLT